MLLFRQIPYYLKERFAQYLQETESGCIEFSGGKVRDGYGWFNHPVEEVSGLAHRFAFLLHHGFIESELMVCHTCDNPACCNPKHLFQSTGAGNMLDMRTKGRSPNNKGSINPNAKLSDEQVAEIRALKEIWPKLMYKVIAPLYRVTPEMVSLILRGKYRVS